MAFELKTDILGFDAIKTLEINKIDELFATAKSDEVPPVTFTLLNPYLLREYSFDIPTSIKVLLDIHEGSNLEVYCLVVIQDPLDESLVNFAAPIIFNTDNNLAAQVVLTAQEAPNYNVAEAIKNFRKK
jgi:flagellar assembly factor FliW